MAPPLTTELLCVCKEEISLSLRVIGPCGPDVWNSVLIIVFTTPNNLFTPIGHKKHVVHCPCLLITPFVLRLICGLDRVNANHSNHIVQVQSGKETAAKLGLSFVVSLLNFVYYLHCELIMEFVP